jgi:putative ABC transport system permease protein
MALLLGVIGLVALASLGIANQTAAFFGAGGLALIAGLMFFGGWLRGLGAATIGAGPASLGVGYSKWRPSRSVLCAALIAFASFVLISVGAFQRDPAGISLAQDSGTGGYALMAESVAPLLFDPNHPRGREELGITDPTIQRATVTRFRLRPGDEASCLTLYRPSNPRIIAPEDAFVRERRFTFAASLASTDAERENPWLLLQRKFDDGAIPAVVDQTSLTYVFHLKVGDDFEFAPDGVTPVRLRFVGALVDSVLQSEVIISEASFVRLFPRNEGYRVWLIRTEDSDPRPLATALERQLSDFGVDVIDTRERLAAYHAVENTYLATFQALGALGLLLGTAGLAAVLARNVLERRRELGLLGAVGFTGGHLRTMVVAESGLLVGVGLGLGTITALLAVAPALIERATPPPLASLFGLLIAVATTGLIAAAVAARIATRTPVVEAIRGE